MDFDKFFLQEDVQNAVKAKTKDIQDKGFIEKDFETEIDGKKVRFSLPNDIRKQLYMMSLCQKWLFDGSMGFKESYDCQIEYFEFIQRNMLLNGEEVKNLSELQVDDLNAYGMVYFLELMLPLFHRSSTKRESSVKTLLKGYLNK